MPVKHGSIRKCTIRGITFPVRKDVSISVAFAKWIQEKIANGDGTSSQKWTANEPKGENLVLTVTEVEAHMIAGWAQDMNESSPVNITLVSGSQLKAPCSLSVGNYDSIEGQLPVSVFPDDQWEVFGA